MFVYSASVLWNVLNEDSTRKVLLVFTAVLILVKTLQSWLECRSLPPGPWGVPVFGSLLKIKGDLHLFYRDLTHKYGSLISTRLGSQLIVVLSDYKTIRDAFRREEFTGRPISELTNILEGYGKWYFHPFFFQVRIVISKYFFFNYDVGYDQLTHFKLFQWPSWVIS